MHRLPDGEQLVDVEHQARRVAHEEHQDVAHEDRGWNDGIVAAIGNSYKSRERRFTQVILEDSSSGVHFCNLFGRRLLCSGWFDVFPLPTQFELAAGFSQTRSITTKAAVVESLGVEERKCSFRKFDN